jgi:hypothetical protein
MSLPASSNHWLQLALLIPLALSIACSRCLASPVSPSTYSFMVDTVFADEPIATRTSVAGAIIPFMHHLSHRRQLQLLTPLPLQST